MQNVLLRALREREDLSQQKTLFLQTMLGVHHHFSSVLEKIYRGEAHNWLTYTKVGGDKL